MHIPVMLNEVIRFLDPKPNLNYVDATFGAGGYTRKILSKKANVVAFDVDSSVSEFADKVTHSFNDHFKFINSNYVYLEQELIGIDLAGKIDGIVFDLGVSSMQLDQAERGFSFNKEATIDMRMGSYGLSAYEVVNNLRADELADIIYYYGDENKARRIARDIVEFRRNKKIETTTELRSIILKSVKFDKKDKIDPATKTFQAIRIYVNDEIINLEKTLAQIKKILKPGGLAIFVTFHSIEDRIVKNFFKTSSGLNSSSRYLPINQGEGEDLDFKIITKKPLVPSAMEVDENPRARSAKLRVYERI
ncbi:16S rRNA (cytosine(1402)-N(4))-methyltransferase RsmH [Rickettsiales bacterium]|nr:16S rRNA (cytosine(1402)-N(4))-methyltransferase RsmH [Rickettsiales bacterium]